MWLDSQHTGSKRRSRLTAATTPRRVSRRPRQQSTSNGHFFAWLAIAEAGLRPVHLTSFSIDDHTDHCYFCDPFVG
jgi:hypothetical protein